MATSSTILRLLRAALLVMAVIATVPIGAMAAELRAIVFSPQGDLLAAAAIDGVVRIWDPRSGAYLRTLKDGTGPTTALAFAPDGVRLAASYADRTIRLWNVEKGSVVGRITGRPADSLAFLADGDRLVMNDVAEGRTAFVIVSTENGAQLHKSELVIANALDRAERPPLPTGNICLVRSLASAPDGGSLAASDLCGRVAVYDSGNWQFRWAVQRANGAATPPTPIRLSFSSDSTLLAGASENVVLVWLASSGKERRRFQGHRAPVSAVAFSPAGQPLLASVSRESVKLWNAQSRQLHWGLALSGGGARPDLAFSPDGETIAVTDAAEIKLVNAHSGEARRLEMPRN